MRVSRPVGIGVGLLLGTLVAAVIAGDGFLTGLARGALVGGIAFAVSLGLELWGVRRRG